MLREGNKLSDINVYVIDLGSCSVPGTSTVNEDGTLTIFLNARVNREKMLKTYQHELRHYYNDDFHTDNVDYIEAINEH